MSTPEEQMEAIKRSVEIAERRLKELSEKPILTRAEEFEKEMTEECIRRGKHILDDGQALF